MFLFPGGWVPGRQDSLLCTFQQATDRLELVHRSPFTVRRSSFVVRRSSFVVRRSSFVVRRSPLAV